jgi:glycosyltransferase involved in cell wall biosynthesis
MSGIKVLGLPKFSSLWFIKSLAVAIGKSIQEKDCRKSAFVNRFFTKYKLNDVDLAGFDVIHVQSIHSQFQSVANVDSDVTKVLTVHSYDDVLKTSGRPKEHLIRVHLSAKSWFDEVIHVSQTDQSKSFALGLEDSNRRVIHNPVAVSCCEPRGKVIDILFVGGLTSRKRPELVLKAVKSLAFEVKCFVIGGGPLAKELEEIYGEYAEFSGFVSHHEVLELMARSRVLCVPSVSESFGLVYVEAALEGAAVIGYLDTISEIADVTRLSAEARAYFVGFDPDESDPEVMADALTDILCNHSRDSKKVSASIGAKLASQFSGEAYMKKIQKVYGKRPNE